MRRKQTRKKQHRRKQTKKKRIAKSNKTHKKYKTYKKKDFESDSGMLTTVWGPSLWHFLHTMSFNYKMNPTSEDKKNYKQFVLSLVNILPCKYCRMNLKKNLKTLPLKNSDMKNRKTFSKWVYNLHELVNKMLGKKSGLTYCKIRERYEHFRSRCTRKEIKQKIMKKTLKLPKKMTKKKEKGCTEPLYGKKAKCIIKIVPLDNRKPTFQMDKKCEKKRLEKTQKT